MSDSDSGEDWFDKDEDEIVAKVQQNKANAASNDNIEFITCVMPAEHNLNQRLVASVCTEKNNVPRISTPQMRKIVQMSPLDAFLFASTVEPNFFVDQVAVSDSHERIQIYIHILAMISELELPGFHEDILRYFATNTILLEHLCEIVDRLFSKRYKSWADSIAEIIHNIQILLLHACRLHLLLNENGERPIVQHFWKAIEKSDSPTITKLPSCIEFKMHLDHIIHSQRNTDTNTEERELFPDLRDLVQTEFTDIPEEDDEAKDTELNVTNYENYGSIENYVGIQKQRLRNDFLMPLREYIQQVRAKEELDQGTLYEDVCIVLNEEFLNANRHEMVFVDMLGSLNRQKGRNESRSLANKLEKFKTGALLCFTTSRDFENLILAKVRYTDVDVLSAGYINIEVQRQHNIGNIYNKPLLMFETPAFFEPYNNVYKHLSTCDLNDFPMRDYIVFGKTDVKPADDLMKNPKCNNPAKFRLNETQLAAYKRALSKELCLIQGPPGSGKTHLSVDLMKTLILQAPTPIVLIAYTNDSLDKLLLKVSAHTDNIVRLGSQSRLAKITKYNIRSDRSLVNPHLKRLWYVVGLECKERFVLLQKLQNEFDGSDENYQQLLSAQNALNTIMCKVDCLQILFQYYVVKEKGIMAMTSTCGAKMNYLFRLLRTSVVVFEEAAEILEPHVISCLTPHVKRVIMIGDHMQLQPYTASYRHSRTSKLNISLFERLIRNGLRPAVLNTQYRMRPIIASLLCPTIYDKLFNDPAVESYPNILKMSTNLFFVTHTQPEDKMVGDSSICNRYEVAQVVELAMHLVNAAAYISDDIVILSPYIKQIELIKKELSKHAELNEIKAATVDSYQGLEANIILLSLVRSGSENDTKNMQIGFLSEKNRVCVALSRAKHGLFIIGNMDLLAKRSKTWKAIRIKLETLNAIGEKFPFDDSQI